MNVSLRPLREHEFGAWLEHHAAWFAADLVANGLVSPEAAREKADRDIMHLFEQEARARGFPKVMLNVFGGNERARALYQSLGYAKLSVHMGKPL